MDDRTLRTEVQELVAGQQFIPIDPRPYLATLARAEATRQRDMAQLANAGQDVVRAQRLASAGAGTSRNRDAMLAQQAARKATLSSDEAAIYEAQLNLSFTQISSPLVGRVCPVRSMWAEEVETGVIAKTRLGSPPRSARSAGSRWKWTWSKNIAAVDREQ
jgi:multidrug efflux pump subunit AcrA (membrane-fusion protein)